MRRYKEFLKMNFIYFLLLNSKNCPILCTVIHNTYIFETAWYNDTGIVGKIFEWEVKIQMEILVRNIPHWS